MLTDLCPNPKQLRNFVTGRLPEPSLDAIAEHLESCTECESAMATLENASDSFIAELQCPAGDESFASEPEFRETLSTVERFDAATVEQKPIAQSRQVLGQYMLAERLGTGGMGTVYKALHTKLEKFVALKILRTKRMLDDRAIARFDREMKAVGKLKHENIVQASDAGEMDGKQYLVMEYIEGAEFSELIQRNERLSVADACELVRQAAVGLQHAHDHGLVHRDIKPSNLMLANDGFVKILDLGLAGYAGEQFDSSGEGTSEVDWDDLTLDGHIMGTAEYIAPEQARNSRDVDVRADIYSLGCTLFALLSGVPPFQRHEFATPRELIDAHQSAERPSIADLPPEIARIINRMLAIDPNERFASPADVAKALDPFAKGHNVAELLSDEKPKLAGDRTKSRRSRRPKTLVFLATLLLLVATGFAAFPIVFNLNTPYGTVEVHTDDPNVEISVRQAGKEIDIINAKSGWDIRLKEGKYDLNLKSGEDKFKLSNDTVTVSRDDKVVLRVTLKRATPPKVASDPPKRRRYMLKFSGRETYVEVPKLRYDGSHPITIEATVMSLYLGSIVADFSGAGLGLDVTNGYVSFHVNDGRDADNGYVRIKSKTSVGRGKPVHIAGVLDGNKLSLYVDGKLQGTETIGEFNKAEFPLMIGADPGGQGEPTKHLIGIIDEVRVSKTARYDKDFVPARNFTSDKDTMVLFAFDEGEGSVANDLSGNELHGKIHSPNWLEAEVPGIADSAAIKRLNEMGVQLTEKNGVIVGFGIGSSQKITDADLAVFESLGTLESVTLIGCPNVTDAGLAHLKHLSRLQQLNLSPSSITDEGLQHVSGLKDLWMLGLNGTTVTDAGMKHLVNNEKITVLYLNATKVTDEGLSFLEAMGDMYWLDLNATAVTDVGLGRLSHMSKLKLLHLTGTKVTDGGMKHLAKLPNLENLYLSDTAISDAGILQLGKLDKLKVLHVVNTRVTQKGIDELQRLLPKVAIHRDLTPTTPDDNFMKYGHAAELKRWAKSANVAANVEVKLNDDGQVVEVIMGGGDITDEGMSHLRHLKDVETLILSYNYACSAESLRHVQQMTKVKYLRLWGSYNFSEGINYVSGMKDVETLFTHKLPITDDNMKFLKDMKKLKLIQMTLNSAVSDAGIAHMAHLTELESVYLTTDHLTDECLKYFHDMTKLKSIMVHSPHITREGLRGLARKLPNVEKVNNEPVEKLFEPTEEEKKQAEKKEAKPEDFEDARREAVDPKKTTLLSAFAPASDKKPAATEVLLRGRDCIEIVNSMGCYDISKEFTAEVWVRFKEGHGRQTLMGDFLPADRNPMASSKRFGGWMVEVKDEKKLYDSCEIEAGRGQGLHGLGTGAKDLFKGKWHHFAMVKNEQGYTLFVDGLNRGQTTKKIEPDDQSSTNLYIGSPPKLSHPAFKGTFHGDRHFYGDIRSFRLTKGVRYATNFKPVEKLESDSETLVLLDATRLEGGKLVDLSGNKRHGVILRDGKRVEKALPMPYQTSFPMQALHVVMLDERKVREEFVKLVTQIGAKIPFLDTNLVLYDREMFRQQRQLFSDDEQESLKQFRQLVDSIVDESWEPLLNNNDAKVRTLAMSALYLRGEISWLPKFVEMSTDTAPTFPAHQLRSALFLLGGGPRTAEERRKHETFTKQTVGDFAKAIVRNYMMDAGYSRGIEGTDDHPGFDDYWEKRKGRDYCLSWFAVELERASQNSSSFPGREKHFKKLREKIDGVVPPYRDCILFALGTSGGCGCEKLVPPEELLQVGKRLGPDRMMDLLRGKTPTDDPDFKVPSGGGFQYDSAVRYILRNAKELLRAKDAAELQAIDDQHWQNKRDKKYHFVFAGWSTAAADLDPPKAKEILLESFRRFQGGEGTWEQDNRVFLAQSLWKHDGMDSAKLIVDWFFNEKSERGAIGFGTQRFANSLAELECKSLLAAIINDKRLTDLEWGTLQCLVRSLNKVSSKPVITEDEIRKAWHPLGVAHYHTSKEKARKAYPKETADLESNLESWRKKMRAAIAAN